jgi:hypothetical protein
MTAMMLASCTGAHRSGTHGSDRHAHRNEASQRVSLAELDAQVAGGALRPAPPGTRFEISERDAIVAVSGNYSDGLAEFALERAGAPGQPSRVIRRVAVWVVLTNPYMVRQLSNRQGAPTASRRVQVRDAVLVDARTGETVRTYQF